MNNLEKIQKTMKVFQTLTKIVMGFSFVAIAFTLVVGSVSLMADKLPFGELLQRLLIEADRTIDNREIGIALLCESVVLVFGAIEAICVCRYFKLELSEGTPFTETGAKSITKLGILFIVVDVLSAAFSSAMEKFAFVSEGIDTWRWHWYWYLLDFTCNGCALWCGTGATRQSKITQEDFYGKQQMGTLPCLRK